MKKFQGIHHCLDQLVLEDKKRCPGVQDSYYLATKYCREEKFTEVLHITSDRKLSGKVHAGLEMLGVLNSLYKAMTLYSSIANGFISFPDPSWTSNM